VNSGSESRFRPPGGSFLYVKKGEGRIFSTGGGQTGEVKGKIFI